jgi:hypothetical protein
MRTMFCLLALLLPSTLFAGSIPLWTEQVIVSATSASLSPITNPTFTIYNLESQFSSSVNQMDALIEFQGSSPSDTLSIDLAEYGSSTSQSGIIPINIYSVPASANPPSIFSISESTYLYTVNVETGDYYANPLPLVFTGTPIDNQMCFLVGVGYPDPSYGPPSIVIDPSSVPEPSTLILALSAFFSLGTLFAAKRRRVKL